MLIRQTGHLFLTGGTVMGHLSPRKFKIQWPIMTRRLVSQLAEFQLCSILNCIDILLDITMYSEYEWTRVWMNGGPYYTRRQVVESGVRSTRYCTQIASSCLVWLLCDWWLVIVRWLGYSPIYHYAEQHDVTNNVFFVSVIDGISSALVFIMKIRDVYRSLSDFYQWWRFVHSKEYGECTEYIQSHQHRPQCMRYSYHIKGHRRTEVPIANCHRA